MHDTLTLRSRFRGCLLGGAAGDALGYPVEFISEQAIRETYGPRGIRTLAQAGRPALATDDTQMSLFTANGMLYGLVNENTVRADHIWLAYREWLGTQWGPERMDDPAAPRMWLYREPLLHALRAPGNTCLSAICDSPNGGTPERPVNHSKGCGGVMRVAPLGLLPPRNPWGLDAARLGAEAAALTHGHLLGWTPGAALARIVQECAYGGWDDLGDAVLCAAADLSVTMPCAQEVCDVLVDCVTEARDAALADLDGIHSFGEGWVGDEALYIAVFCAVRYQNDFAAALRCAVNHKGDADSTGAIAGNILGAWLGEEALAAAFELENIDLYAVTAQMADDLYAALADPDRPDGWQERYRVR